MRSLVLTRSERSLGRFLAGALLVGTLLTGVGATPAEAGIASSTGAVNVRTAPTGTLSTDALESDTNIDVWFESSVASGGMQAFDHVGPGLVNSTVIGNLPNPATVNVGGALSYLIHIDQATDATAINYSGTITFSVPIIGLWFRTGSATSGLTGSDAQFKSAGMSFGTLPNRRWELTPIGTTRNFTISPDQLTLTLNQQNGVSEVDQIRVLINPEPSSGVLAGLGVLALAAFVRRRRRAGNRSGAAPGGRRASEAGPQSRRQ